MLTGSSNVVQSHHSLTSTLDDVVERRAQGSVAALFDVDNTLLPGEASEVGFFGFLWRRGLVGWGELTRSAVWLAGHVPPFSLHSLREQKVYLTGKCPADIESHAREFCRAEMIGKLSVQGRARLDVHRQAGHQLILVTGAPDFLIVPLAEFLGVPTVFAAKPEQRDSVYTGALIPPLPYGRGKRELILAHAQEWASIWPAPTPMATAPAITTFLNWSGTPWWSTQSGAWLARRAASAGRSRHGSKQ